MTLRFICTMIANFLFRNRWTFPEFIIRPSRLLYDSGLVMSTVFVGRQGSGKTLTLAMELLENLKLHTEQPIFIFDWSGVLSETLFKLFLSDPKRDEILPRLVYDAMGSRTVNDEVFIMPMPEFSEKYDLEKPWLERVEDQVDRVQRTIESLNPSLVELNPTIGGRPVKSLLPNLLLLVNAIVDDSGTSWQITEA